jgi:predicted histidine transporter YuiF (NhaC family)
MVRLVVVVGVLGVRFKLTKLVIELVVRLTERLGFSGLSGLLVAGAAEALGFGVSKFERLGRVGKRRR